MLIAQASTTATGETISVVLVVAGVLLIAILMMVSIRQKIAARQADRPGSRETLRQIHDFARQSDDSHQANAAFYETAQRLMAQLDNKAERLEQLIEQADQRLTRLSEAADDAPATRGGSAAGNVIEPKSAPAPSERRQHAPSESSAPVPNHRQPVDPLARSVYALADDGRSAVEIARQLDEQIGKVELILALRHSR